MGSIFRKTLSVKNCLAVSLYIQVLIVQVVNFSFNETRNVHETVLKFYANEGKHLKTLIPTEDQSRPISVLLTFHLNSLDEFDSRTGEMKVTGSLLAEWKDETLATSIGNYSLNGKEGHTVFLPSDVVWTPNIRLNNAVVIHKPSYRSYLLRYNVYDGRIIWNSKMKMTVTCKPDVKHFPFDFHVCDMTFSPHGYISDEIQLESAQSYLDYSQYTSNGVWEIVEVKTEHIIRNNKSNIKFSFQIERKSLLTLINIILPIILIAILSSFVFLLPPRSARRIQFSTVCFLSFVFLLRTILQSLPQSADPVPSFCYFVFTMMAINACVVIVTVFILRVHHKTTSENVPTYIQKVTKLVSCVSCKNICQKNKNTTTADYTGTEASNIIKPPDTILKVSDFSNIRPSTRMTLASRMSVTTYSSSSKDTFASNADTGDRITWFDVARAMDIFFFVLFIICHCLVSFVFILSLALTTE